MDKAERQKLSTERQREHKRKVKSEIKHITITDKEKEKEMEDEVTIPKKEEIHKLGSMKTKEWILFHKYRLFKAKNDLLFHKQRLDRLNFHFASLKKQKLYGEKDITEIKYDKNVPDEELEE